MPMFNITDENKSTEAITDQTVISALTDFRNKLVENNSVSRNDILSIESLVESPMISERHNINSYSEYPTTINLTETLKTVNGMLDNSKQENALTKQDVTERVVKTQMAIMGALRRIVNTVLGNLAKNDNGLDRFLNDKIKYRYDDKDTLLDVSKLDIIDALENHYTYFDKAITNRVRSNDFFRTIRENDTTLPLLNLIITSIKNNDGLYMSNINKIDVMSLSTYDIIEMLRQPELVKDFLRGAVEMIKNYNYNLRDSYVLYDQSDIDKNYKMLKMTEQVFKDEVSLQILELLATD